MVLTSSYQRRTAGFTALFAAILLILTAVLIASPAAADSHTGTCKDVAGYGAVGNIVGDSAGDWGTIDHTADGPLNLNVNEGYTLHLCLKKGSGTSGAGAVDTGPYVGPIVDQEVRYSDGHGLSHYSYRVVGTPTGVTPEEAGFTDPDCDTAAAVDVPETEGVAYSIAGVIAPGETVTVTATPQAGYEFPDGATTEWVHTFATIDEDCDPPVEVTTAEPTFANPNCEVNEIGLTVPGTTGVVYEVSGDQQPGGMVTITATAAEGYRLAEDAETQWQHTYGPLATDCEEEPEPTTGVEPDEVVKTPAPDVVKTPAPDVVEVSPNVVEKPAPTPAPAVQPAAQAAAAQELPATGLGSTELLLLALLMLGLGAAALLGSDPRRQN